jgi:hypothetical protein
LVVVEAALALTGGGSEAKPDVGLAIDQIESAFRIL